MPPLPEYSSASSPVASEQSEYSAAEREVLLKVAHAAIESAFTGESISRESPSPHLSEPRGVFTTLYCGGNLHGCVGHILAVVPLYEGVIDTARAAAFEDTRFPPIAPSEISRLRVSLSVLSPLHPIHPEGVEVGRHGLLISLGHYRGLLLPQVPVEHGWDREIFLQQTCRKAGLPMNAWQTGASIEAFTAEVFGESETK